MVPSSNTRTLVQGVAFYDAMFCETTTSVISKFPSDFASLIGGKGKCEARLEKISWTTEPDILSHTLQTPQYKCLIPSTCPFQKYPEMWKRALAALAPSLA